MPNNYIDLSLVENIHSKCNEKESLLRLEIFRKMLDSGQALTKGMIKDQETLNHLLEKNIVVAEEANIIFAYPISTAPTAHKVKLKKEGIEFYAMCAIDAMGSAFTFDQDVEITSYCPVTGEKIFVHINDGKLHQYSPRTLHVMHRDLNKNKNWAVSC